MRNRPAPSRGGAIKTRKETKMARSRSGTGKVAEDVTQMDVEQLAAEFTMLEEKLDKLTVRIAAKCHRDYKAGSRPNISNLQHAMRSLAKKAGKNDEFLNSVYDLYN